MFRLYLFFLASLFSATIHPNLFWKASNTAKERIAHIADYRTSSNAWVMLDAAICQTPDFLTLATQQDCPIIFIVREALEGKGPLDDEAPLIEGARTALAWARAFYQIMPNRYDLRIIKVPTNTNPTLSELITHALQQHTNNRSIPFESAIAKTVSTYTPNTTRTEKLEYTCEALIIAPTQEKTVPIPTPWTMRAGKRYLVAGGAGFIGRHLTQRLLQDNNQVLVLDNFQCSDPENIAEFLENPNFHFVKHDITKPFTVDGPIDYIIHLASLPSPDYYYRMPYETLTTGLQGTKNLIELAQIHNARFMFTSTSEVYGDPEVHPQPETYAGNVNYLGKRSQYDQSKRGAETLLKLYFERYGIDIRIARLFNTYGPYMMLHDGRSITNFIAAILEDKPITIYGTGSQTRSFAYVSDTVDGLYRLIHNEELTHSKQICDRVFNIGTPIEFTINELATKVQQLSSNRLHKPATALHIPQPDQTDPKMRLPDISRAKTILGFSPKIELEQGLLETFNYFFHQKCYKTVSE